MGLELRADSGNIYLHAQIFTGLMYIVAALCLWFLRAWKIKEVEKIENEREQLSAQQLGVVGKTPPQLARTNSRVTSVKSTIKTAKGLFAWKRV
jgi:HAMP domain-containing protein